jgi:hypothetical protein
MIRLLAEARRNFWGYKLKITLRTAPLPLYGLIFWFTRNRFAGSYLRLTATSRS